MTEAYFEILRAGTNSSIQDQGRKNLYHIGITISGAMDQKIFDKVNLNNPALIKPGDKVSFYKITKEEYLNWND